MYVDFRERPPPPPWEPRREPRRPKLTPRERRVFAAIIGFNLVLLLVAPVGGASLVGVLVWLFG